MLAWEEAAAHRFFSVNLFNVPFFFIVAPASGRFSFFALAGCGKKTACGPMEMLAFRTLDKSLS